MTVQSVHYTFAPEDAETALAILRELRDASRQEPGILTFEIVRDRANPHAFALWEEYRDEAAIDAHTKTEHFERLVLNGIRKLAKARDFQTGEPI